MKGGRNQQKNQSLRTPTIAEITDLYIKHTSF